MVNKLPIENKKKTVICLDTNYREMLAKTMAVLENFWSSQGPGEKRRRSLRRAWRFFYHKQEFYLYMVKVRPHPAIKLPKNMVIREGQKEDLARLVANMEGPPPENWDKYSSLVVVDKHGETIAYSWISQHLPRDLERFIQKPERAIYVHSTYTYPPFRRMGILKSITRFRDNIFLKQGLETRVSLVATSNKSMNSMYLAMGERPLAKFTSTRILGIIKKLEFIPTEQASSILATPRQYS